MSGKGSLQDSAGDVVVLEGVGLVAVVVSLNGTAVVQAVGFFGGVLARGRGWQVTGLARASDEPFVRGLSAGFATVLGQGWDAVVDAGALQEPAPGAMPDGGRFAGVQPAARLPEERGITVEVVSARPDGRLLADLLARVAAG